MFFVKDLHLAALRGVGLELELELHGGRWGVEGK